MAKKPAQRKRRARRQYSDELRAEAVQMLLDGRSAESVVKNLGLSGTSLLYRWKAWLLEDSGSTATALDLRVHQLEEELRRVERERDILKKCLSHFQPEDVTEFYVVIEQFDEEGDGVSLRVILQQPLFGSLEHQTFGRTLPDVGLAFHLRFLQCFGARKSSKYL